MACRGIMPGPEACRPACRFLVWLDQETYAAFRQSALEARMPLERFVALHLRECAQPIGKGPP